MQLNYSYTERTGFSNIEEAKRGFAENPLIMNRKNAYILSQVTGWAAFTAVNLIVVALFDALSLRNALIWLTLFAGGFLFTHLYRKIIKEKNWIALPLKKLIFYILAASLFIGFCLYIITSLTSYIFTGFDFSDFSLGRMFLWFFNLSSVVFVWSLIYFGVHYFENYKRSEIESYIWEAAVKDYELKTLKSQLNPHFMFNAMNSIRALIGEEPQNAQDALTKLSNILRYSLKAERSETVPLEEEIQTVTNYLELEKVRFEERLKFKIKLDPKSKKIEIPPMMIQTLVENGIKHGISKRAEGGEIFVASGVNNGKLFITIKNSGHINLEELKHSKGFGIQNTKHRLNLLYGEHASFNINNIEGGYVLSEIKFPIGGIKNESFNSR